MGTGFQFHPFPHAFCTMSQNFGKHREARQKNKKLETISSLQPDRVGHTNFLSIVAFPSWTFLVEFDQCYPWYFLSLSPLKIVTQTPKWPQSTVASIFVHSSLKSPRKYTLSYIFTVLIEHHDQATCRRKGLFDYSSRGLRIHPGGEVWPQATGV